MVLDGEDLGLRVKMALGGHLQRPSGNTEGGILDPLEFEDSRGGGVGKPNGGGVGKKGLDQGFEGQQQGLPRLPPAGSRQGF